jgi:hypothetical protein
VCKRAYPDFLLNSRKTTVVGDSAVPFFQNTKTTSFLFGASKTLRVNCQENVGR